ncbi:MAG TPA: M23 family metallopeptidase [Nevskiaceae bacterium]|nr:M23 family metallopeptidase [Nevskiaceae bacterium]
MSITDRLLPLLALLLPVLAQPADELMLKGDWTEGHVVLGHAPPGTRAWFNGRALSVSDTGAFIFGLDRDARGSATLKLQLPGEKEPQLIRRDVATREYQVQRIDGLPESKVNPPPSAMKQIERDAAILKAARKRDTAFNGFDQDMQWPLTGRITGSWGNQRILNGVPKSPHAGTDIAVPVGTPVAAPADGVVSVADPDMYYTGGTLMIDHGHGLQSMLIHLSRLKVKKGDVVRRGQIVAESGMTGRATGPHLHWGMFWFDARIDPQTLVPPMPVQEKGATP